MGGMTTVGDYEHKRRRGRPAMAEGKATRVMQLRVTDAQYAAYSAAAGERTLSGWAKGVLDRAAKRRSGGTGR